MSDSSQGRPGTDAIQVAVSPQSSEFFVSFVPDGQLVQAPSLGAAILDLRSEHSNRETDLHALDPAIQRTSDNKATGDLQASGNPQPADDLHVAGPVTQYPQVPASGFQSPVAVGLQIPASVSITIFFYFITVLNTFS